tara:strand:- start:2073 stop:3503 length:1431 start_codon:yes stop_codon:yes gene_type:complete
MEKNKELLKNAKVTVIGDAILDKYCLGTTERVSPEAPVPIVKINEEIHRPGGAANVAANLVALGCKVTLVSQIGKDQDGKILKNIIKSLKIKLITTEESRIKTITKTRVLSRNQQLIRIDNEINTEDLNYRKLYNAANRSIKDCDAVIFSDYKKGFLKDIKLLIKQSNSCKKPIFIDPKGDNFLPYKGALIMTPNLKEFENIVGECKNNEEIESKAKKLIIDLNLKAILITLGSKGMLLVEKNKKSEHIPAVPKEVYDVTGAGDTVIATLCASFVSGNNLRESAFYANLAAGEVITKLGTSYITKNQLSNLVFGGSDSKIYTNHKDFQSIIEDLKNVNIKVGFTNGCFDVLHKGHIKYLEIAKKNVDVLIVAVNDDDSVKKLKGNGRPINNLQDRMEMLQSISCIDYVTCFSEQTPLNIIKKLNPDVLMKGGDYKLDEVVGADIIQKNGGKVMIIPYVEGNSTSNIIKKIKAKKDI